jgi:hypothetical protein
MIELALFFILTTEPLPLFFPGYEPLPNPTQENCVIVPLENPASGVSKYTIITI